MRGRISILTALSLCQFRLIAKRLARLLRETVLPLAPFETADLISRTGIAAVVCLKTGANAHRLILFAENCLNQQSRFRGEWGEG